MNILIPITLLLAVSAHAAGPGDADEGKLLHDASCLTCHDASVYTRKDHKVQSLEDLKQEVEKWTPMVLKKFSPAQTQDMVEYLNDQFYRFQ